MTVLALVYSMVNFLYIEGGNVYLVEGCRVVFKGERTHICSVYVVKKVIPGTYSFGFMLLNVEEREYMLYFCSHIKVCI